MSLRSWERKREAALGVPGDRYRVVIEFIVKADSADDAESDVGRLIEYGAETAEDEEGFSPITEWNVLEADPAEI